MSAAGARHSGSNRRVEYLGLNCAAAREAMRKWMKKVDTSERAAPAWAHSGVRFRAQATLMRAANRKRYGGGDVISPHKPSQASSSNSAKRAASLCLFAGWRSLMQTALRIKFPDHQGKYREFTRFRAF